MNVASHILSAVILQGTLVLMPAQAQQPLSPPAPIKSTLCNTDLTTPTNGDNLLAEKDYTTAEALFREDLAKNPSSADLHLGLIRALIGEDKVVQARMEADSWLANASNSALAEVAAGEVAYRSADIAAAQQHANKAILENHCEGRVLALAANIDSLGAAFAQEANLISLAHRLRPNDEIIRRDWIFSLPLQQRTAELAQYLEETQHLSDDDRILYVDDEERLKAHHPGECRVTTNTDTATFPLKPARTPSLASGLDVEINSVNRHLEVDTGASGIVLTLATSKKLGLKPEHRLFLSGVGDGRTVGSYLTHVANIRIGPFQFADCLVEVLEKTKLNADGFIGTNLFAKWLVTLDYPRSELRLSPLPVVPKLTQPDNSGQPADETAVSEDKMSQPQNRYVAPEMQHWLRVLRIDNMLLVPVKLDQGPLHYFAADTGSTQTTLSVALARETHREYIETGTHFFGIAGDVNKIYRVDDAVLHFGTFQLPPSSYDAFDLSLLLQRTGLAISGLLGLPTLSKLTISIDYRDNLMQLQYDPRHNTATSSPVISF